MSFLRPIVSGAELMSHAIITIVSMPSNSENCQRKHRPQRQINVIGLNILGLYIRNYDQLPSLHRSLSSPLFTPLAGTTSVFTLAPLTLNLALLTHYTSTQKSYKFYIKENKLSSS